MVRVQVVGDVRIDSGPCTESLELALWLGHVRGEEGEITNVGRSHLGVRVGRVVSLVAAHRREDKSIHQADWNGAMMQDVLFNPADEALFGGKGRQLLVMLEQLSGRLGDHHMVA